MESVLLFVLDVFSFLTVILFSPSLYLLGLASAIITKQSIIGSCTLKTPYGLTLKICAISIFCNIWCENN